MRLTKLSRKLYPLKSIIGDSFIFDFLFVSLAFKIFTRMLTSTLNIECATSKKKSRTVRKFWI